MAEEQNLHNTGPVSSHTAWGAALVFLLLSTPRLQLFLPPFFANFSTNTSQLHDCSQPAQLLLQICTALREVHLTYMLLPCPGLQRQMHGHRDQSYCTNPETSPLQFSLPLCSLHWPSWFEKSRGDGLCSCFPWCHLSTAFPQKHLGSINVEPPKPLLKLSADVL